ncbi:unnamed protein product [Linum trigynum]|uniref:Uncharacterized protein n=1 Tax=Linum trigynum TaxID=586398 RepID=A0AAV2CKC9_9ROSI
MELPFLSMLMYLLRNWIKHLILKGMQCNIIVFFFFFFFFFWFGGIIACIHPPTIRFISFDQWVNRIYIINETLNMTKMVMLVSG